MTVAELFALLSSLPAEAKLMFHAGGKEYLRLGANWGEYAVDELLAWHIALEEGK